MKEKVRIIYIEDELRDVELVQAQLYGENYPFEMTHVENKAELLNELKKGDYHVILMDYSLPSFDPLETIQELKSIYPDIPVIIISGTIGEELAIETIKAGAVDYVLKHRLMRLTMAINRAIQLARERKERLRAQQELRQSEEKFRVLAENASDIISIKNLSAEFLYVSPSITEIAGYKDTDLIGKACYDFIHPDDMNAAMRAMEKIKKRDVVIRIEYRFRCKNGKYKWMETRAKKISPDAEATEPVVLSATRDISERKAFEEKLKASLREKEILLNEIHHRVKNNLQIISSLLNLQAARIDNPESKDGFQKSVDRIRTIAMIHEKLYKSDNLAEIKFIEYAKSLVRGLFLAYHNPETNISLVIEGGDARLSIDKAIPCGLIINELVTNALKYAFKGKKKGTITIKFEDLGEIYKLVVSDDGVGLPDHFPSQDSMGSRLLRALTDQLEGKLEIDRTNGAKFTLTFPKKNPRKK